MENPSLLPRDLKKFSLHGKPYYIRTTTATCDGQELHPVVNEEYIYLEWLFGVPGMSQ